MILVLHVWEIFTILCLTRKSSSVKTQEAYRPRRILSWRVLLEGGIPLSWSWPGGGVPLFWSWLGGREGGTSVLGPDLGTPSPLARTRTGVPSPPVRTRTGILPPWGKDLGPETSEQGYLPPPPN